MPSQDPAPRGRPPKHSRESLVSIAVTLTADEGAAALTMQRLATLAGASNGSVYHRFGGRAELLAAVWLDVLEHFQRHWWAGASLEVDPGALAVLPIHWALAHPDAARVLLSNRIDTFLGPETPADQHRHAAALQATTESRWKVLAERLLGDPSAEAVERTVFALATVPLAALRRPLADGAPLRPGLESLVRETAVALLTRRVE